MKRLALALALLLGDGTSNCSPETPRARPREDAPRLPRGLSPDQVRGRLGPPRQVCRQVLAHRHLEQWVYGEPHFLRLEFDCPRGQPPQLQTVRPLDRRLP